jgi:hypothetical protein
MKGIIISALFAGGVSLLVVRLSNKAPAGSWLYKASGRG